MEGEKEGRIGEGKSGVVDWEGWGGRGRERWGGRGGRERVGWWNGEGRLYQAQRELRILRLKYAYVNVPILILCRPHPHGI